MIYNDEFVAFVDNAEEKLDGFIAIIEQQGAKDQFILTLKDVFLLLRTYIANNKKLDKRFLSKWNCIYSFAFRAFEDHPYLAELDELNVRFIANSVKT